MVTVKERLCPGMTSNGGCLMMDLTGKVAFVFGVASEDLLGPMASALNILGMKKAIVIYGYGGIDEASLEGDNKMIFVDNGRLNPTSLNISNFELKNSPNEELVVKDNMSNEEVFVSVLKGNGNESHINVVAFNTALVLWAADIENDIKKGFDLALSSINQGLPWDKFTKLKNYLNE